MRNFDDPLVLLGLLAVPIVIFLIMREVMLWYFKINTSLKIMKQQVYLMQKIAQKLGAEGLEDVEVYDTVNKKTEMWKALDWLEYTELKHKTPQFELVKKEKAQ